MRDEQAVFLSVHGDDIIQDDADDRIFVQASAWTHGLEARCPIKATHRCSSNKVSQANSLEILWVISLREFYLSRVPLTGIFSAR